MGSSEKKVFLESTVQFFAVNEVKIGREKVNHSESEQR